MTQKIQDDSFDSRFEFIRTILKNNKVAPLIHLDAINNPCDTEQYNGPVKTTTTQDKLSRSDSSEDSNLSHDTRYILNKGVFDFAKVINDIGGELLYIKSGATGHTFKGISKVPGENTIINYAVKVVAYNKTKQYGDLYDSRRPENAELCMIKALSYFVVKKQTPHIVLPICTFYTDITNFVNLIKDGYVDEDNTKYKEFVKKYNENKYHRYVSILISEWANKGDLLDFIRKKYKEMTLMVWKVIFFQILSALAVIQNKYPSFRHNDLKANNILIQKNIRKSTTSIYTVNKQKYIVPNINYRIKLWDFDFACIPGFIDNDKVNMKWTDEINVKPVENKYYDMHYFFNTLIKKGFFSEFFSDDVDITVQEFVKRVVPPQYESGEKVNQRGRILVDDEYLTPDIVLKTDIFFQDFRIN